MRCCSICNHFRLDLGAIGYSEWTPGGPGSIDCMKSRDPQCPWNSSGVNDDEGAVEIPALIPVAEACPFYEQITPEATENSDE